MSWVSLLAIYFVVWWLCLFAVLPIGAHSQSDAGEVTQGTEPGAPAMLRLWPKLLATTIVAAIVQAILMWLISFPALQDYWR